MRARLDIASGDLDRARKWSLVCSFAPQIDVESVSVAEILSYARLMIADGDTEHALPVLIRLGNTLAEAGRKHDLIQVLVMTSLAYLDLFRLDQAVESLRDALAIGEAGGYLRVFIDEDMPMVRLLKIVHRRGISVAYVRQLLEAAGEAPGEVVRLTHRDLIEPITAREIEVLGLVTLGLTNKEISDELYLSIATVKRHITNLYGKLGVASRMEAVQRARQLGLLSSDQARVAPAPTGSEIAVH
jgi:LuxR family maltose regulon positive regulatory protein